MRRRLLCSCSGESWRVDHDAYISVSCCVWLHIKPISCGHANTHAHKRFVHNERARRSVINGLYGVARCVYYTLPSGAGCGSSTGSMIYWRLLSSSTSASFLSVLSCCKNTITVVQTFKPERLLLETSTCLNVEPETKHTNLLH